jgi:Concanavalin A-like lectin/glucanases superfamily/Calcineurin-like phosphoesterase
MKLKFVIIVFLAISTWQVFGQDTWTFVSAPDWHAGEREVTPPVDASQIEMQVNALQDMKKWNPELLLIAGDLVGGRWVGEEWIDKYAPGGTQEDALINIGKVAYGNLKQRFSENGMDNVLTTIGDHELSDDSAWKPGNEVSHLLPVFRDAFQRIWNRDEQGRFIYSEPIGSAPSRPLGTAWENTSFAYKYKNVLFISVDIFDTPNPDKPVGYLQRSTHGEMTKEQLKWFEMVLKEARKDDKIKHIIVQAHTPILPPVRGQQTSMLYIEDLEQSTFWKAMEKYKVDLYFAGEVHAPSAQRIKGKFPVQVVHGGYSGKNYLVVEVSNEKLDLKLREVKGQEFSEIGEIIIDKSSNKPTVRDYGMLKFIDSKKPLVHYSFNEIENGQIINDAQMDKYYNLRTEIGLTEGIQGKALNMTGMDMAECLGYGVLTRNHPSTIMVWIKTSQTENSIITSHGNESLSTTIYDIVIKDGSLAVYVRANSCLQTISDGNTINDGRWHHLAVVLPDGGKTLEDIKLYIDGEQKETKVIGVNCPVMVRPAYKMKIGGKKQMISNDIFENFTGAIDEVSVWYKALSANEIKENYRKILMN